MEVHTKSTFLALAFISIGLLIWWWLPVNSNQTEFVERSTTHSNETVEQSDTTVTEPVPTEPLAEPSPIPNSTPEPAEPAGDPAHPSVTVSQVVGEVVQLEVTARRDQSGDEACGPISYGAVAWGNGKSETVYGLGCSASEQTLDISHAYEEYGEYTITFTDEQGVEATTTVLVGGELGNQPRMEVSVDRLTATVVVRGVTDAGGPVAVDGPIVFGDLLWGDGSTTRVSALSGEPATNAHEYLTPGTYTIAFEVAESDTILEETITVE